jgi:hypothetical protein
VAGPGIDPYGEPVHGPAPWDEGQPDRGDSEDPDGRQAGGGPGFESLERFPEASVPLGLDGPEEIRKSRRSRRTEVFERAIVVAEDSTNLLVEETESLPPEGGDLGRHRLPQRLRRRVIRSLEALRRNDPGSILEGPARNVRADGPGIRSVRTRDDHVNRLALLVGDEAQSESEHDQDFFLARDLPDVLVPEAFHPGGLESGRVPFRRGRDRPRTAPTAAALRGRQEPLQDVAARDHELSPETARGVRIEREGEPRTTTELFPKPDRGVDPYDRALWDGSAPEDLQEVDREGPYLLARRHAETSSVGTSRIEAFSPRTAS